MALNLLSSLPASCNFTRLSISLSSNTNVFVPPAIVTRVQYRMAASATTKAAADQTTIRRSANYQPSIWGFDYIQSLKSKYMGEPYAKRMEKLREEVRAMLQQDDPLHQLQLIDTLQRLGLSYHFEDEIKRTLVRIYNKNNSNRSNYKHKQESLYAVALKFRLLRQHGYDIPAKETLLCFMDEKRSSKLSYHGDDCKGILALYEAAYLLVEGESDIFRDAKNFTTTYLKEYVVKHNKNENDNDYLCTLAAHALELPLHWRMQRLEARWFIDVYESGPDRNPSLLELAKLDFNIVQAAHQEDLKYVSRWWKKTGLGEKLNFARDRLMERNIIVHSKERKFIFFILLFSLKFN